MLLGHFLGDVDLALRPVYGLLHTPALNVLGIVVVIVDGSHRRELVKSLNEHALGVEVGKAKRTLNVGHAAVKSPLANGVEKGAAHFVVVDEVNPSEAHHLLIPRLISAVVNDCCNAPYECAIAVCQEVIGITKFECRILRAVERANHVHIQFGNMVSTVLIHLVIEADKGL